jgi:hypothetical protein
MTIGAGDAAIGRASPPFKIGSGALASGRGTLFDVGSLL